MKINVIYESCTAIFTGQTGCGKSELVLRLLKNEYKHHFDYIVFLCSTISKNQTYLECSELWDDDDIFLIEPENNLLHWIDKFSKLLSGQTTLFIVDDMIGDESLSKYRSELLTLATSGRHDKHSLWLLTQVYNAIPKTIRRQCKMLFTWYPKDRSDLKIIDEETNIVEKEDWPDIKDQLKSTKHTALYLRIEFPRSYQIII